MIAVIGRLLAVPVEGGGVAGLAARIAVAAAAGGSRVELVAKLGDDPTGDAVLFALTRAGVGHAAILRDAARPTPVVPAAETVPQAVRSGRGDGSSADADWLAAVGDEADDGSFEGGAAAAGTEAGGPDAGLALDPADLELALRYLTDLAVVVLADPAAPGLIPAAADGADYAGAALVVIGDANVAAHGAPGDATVLTAPSTDPDAVFATMVAEYAVALDGGRTPAEAWAAATKRVGAERA